MKLWTSIILSTLTLPFFIGCGSSVKKMTVSDTTLENKHPYSVKVEVTGWEKIGKLQTSGLSNERYAQTLTNSIKNTGLFKDVIDNGSDYKLKVTVLEHILPAHVGDFDLQLKTNWQLTDTTGKVIWTDTIASVYTSKLIDELTTFDRLQKANENLTKINIGDGLKNLSQLKL
ncbi:MAG: hypothetical protein A2Y10_12225 [Planctomycetes bacterium GWF2_41_51]|nr:MAG: hypothetical protein A2Y10_12225 [Planctomycetes bacterium GWF2_41_51]HBG28712.1 hypothetical protein [Phycisphaerales bacterium]